MFGIPVDNATNIFFNNEVVTACSTILRIVKFVWWGGRSHEFRHPMPTYLMEEILIPQSPPLVNTAIMVGVEKRWTSSSLQAQHVVLFYHHVF